MSGGVWSGRRGSNPRPTAWKAVTLPLSYSRLRASPASPFGASPGKPATRSLAAFLRFAFPDPLTGLPAEAASAASDSRRLVAREGFEPSKPLGRQIYSLLRLTASLPRRNPPPASLSLPFPADALPHDSRVLVGSRSDSAIIEERLRFRVDERVWGRPSPERWSWRRDLNPRPADYKSAALPG